MGTNVEKNSQTASQLQPAVGGEIVLYQPDNNIRLEVQLDTLVKDMNQRATLAQNAGSLASAQNHANHKKNNTI